MTAASNKPDEALGQPPRSTHSIVDGADELRKEWQLNGKPEADIRSAALEEADQACRLVAWNAANEGDTEQENAANKCRAAILELFSSAPGKVQGAATDLPKHFALFNINGPDRHRIKGYTADVLLAGIHAVCVGASQEYARCKGVMPQWDGGFFAGQMHVFDMYTKADKTAISEANDYLAKLNAAGTAEIAEVDESDFSMPINMSQAKDWITQLRARVQELQIDAAVKAKRIVFEPGCGVQDGGASGSPPEPALRDGATASGEFPIGPMSDECDIAYIRGRLMCATLFGDPITFNHISAGVILAALQPAPELRAIEATEAGSVGDDPEFARLLVEYWASSSRGCKDSLIDYIDSLLSVAGQSGKEQTPGEGA